jgi:hypothetical protein
MAYLTAGSYGTEPLHRRAQEFSRLPHDPQALRARASRLARLGLGYLAQFGADGLDMATGAIELAAEYTRRACEIEGSTPLPLEAAAEFPAFLEFDAMAAQLGCAVKSSALDCRRHLSQAGY